MNNFLKMSKTLGIVVAILSKSLYTDALDLGRCVALVQK